MDLASRIERYLAIEEYRNRPLVVYATSTRSGVPAQMAGDAVREFIDQIDTIESSDQIDILIHSTGGDALAAWKLMSVLRERFSYVSVLVPHSAFSAATLFALGADEIVMHPHASLGPIDPQIRIKLSDAEPRLFSFEDLGAFLRFLSDEVGITEQIHTSAVMDKLFTVVDPVNIGGAKRASELSTSVGERLLLMHLNKPEEKQRAHQVAENLNKSFFSHGDAVSRTRAKELDLKIAEADEDLHGLIWDAYLGLEAYMELRTPFKPLEHFLASSEGAEQLKPTLPLQLPSNAPPQVVNQVWSAAAQQALAGLSNPAVEVPYSLVNALVESSRLASEFRTSGAISACRIPGGEIKIFATDHTTGWKRVDTPTSEEEAADEEGSASSD
jgi:hypothetical protein